MLYLFDQEEENSVYWEINENKMGVTGQTAGRTLIPLQMNISRATKHWKMSFCHELGHVLLANHPDMSSYFDDDVSRYHIEYLAWCLAKAYCKKEYWNEEQAVDSLNTYYLFFCLGKYDKRESIEAISTRKEVMAYTTRREVIV